MTNTITALSIKQPWANWIVEGQKSIETRTWETQYRGPLLICSTKRPEQWALGEYDVNPLGCAVAIAELVDCRRMNPDDEEAANCRWNPDLFAWVLEDVRSVDDPFPVRGKPGLFSASLANRTIDHHAGFDYNSYEQRFRLHGITECPGCKRPALQWVGTSEWRASGSYHWHEAFGMPESKRCAGCGKYICQAFVWKPAEEVES